MADSGDKAIRKNRRTASESGDTGNGGLLKKLVALFNRRFPRVVEVIDEALDSEDFKHRIWAVEHLLKRLIPDRRGTNEKSGPSKPPSSKRPPLERKALAELSEEALLERIEALLKETPEDE